MLSEQIKQDLIAGQKAKDEKVVSCLRMLKAAITNKEIEKRLKIVESNPNLSEEDLSNQSRLNDEEIVEVISLEVKKRRDSILSFEKGGRMDLVERETAELNILKKYMPAELTEEEIRTLVRDIIGRVGASSIKDIGIVMKEVVPQTKGKSDGNLVGQIVREELSK
ncbi:GatB/YqeY domain-containing protein [bacterium]|nr:GatB/YqeY domain-containing protein [bacterium]